MPKKFWEWYKTQDFTLDCEKLWKLKDKKVLLLGIMIKFLLDKGVAIDTPMSFKNFDDFYNWISLGVDWNSGR